MLKATPEEVRAFLCKRLQVILDSAKEPDCGLPLQTVELVEAWSTQSIKVFGLDEGGSLNPLLTSMSAVEDINRLLVRFFKQIQNHESILDETDSTKLNLLYNPVALLACQQYSGVTLSLGRIEGRHARVLEVATCGQAREGGYHYRF